MVNKYRTHNCGELRIKNVNNEVTLSGFVQKIRNLGKMIFIDFENRTYICPYCGNGENFENNHDFLIELIFY